MVVLCFPFFFLFFFFIFLNVETTKEFKERENKLRETWTAWKREKKLPELQALALPHLPPERFSAPKGFDSIREAGFLVRSEALKIFNEIYKWEKMTTHYGRGYGIYLSGPMGVGKSCALYFISCLARSLGWAVIYMADCKEWVERPSKQEQLKFLRDTFKK
jgi:DNA replication protein DnaC